MSHSHLKEQKKVGDEVHLLEGLALLLRPRHAVEQPAILLGLSRLHFGLTYANDELVGHEVTALPAGSLDGEGLLRAHMYALASLPRAVPVLTWCRNASPVLMCLIPYLSTSCSHCVPFPDPGPPLIIIFGTSFRCCVYLYTPYAVAPASVAAPAALSILETSSSPSRRCGKGVRLERHRIHFGSYSEVQT